MTTYGSFAPWSPEDKEFTYDKNALELQGYKLRARLDRRNPDVQKLCDDLEASGNEIKMVDTDKENVYTDIWYRPGSRLKITST